MIQVGNTFKINAIYDRDHWTDFGICPELANVYGRNSEDIREVEISVIEIDVKLKEWYKNNKENAKVYFGFYDYENGYKPSLMWCNAKCYNCCFPNGADDYCYVWDNGIKTDKRKGCTFIFEVNNGN